MSRREPSPEERDVLDRLPPSSDREVPDWVDQLPTPKEET